MANLDVSAAKKLDSAMRDAVKRQVSLNRQSQSNMMEICETVHRMSIIYRAKEPGKPLLGFQTHRDWMLARLEPLDIHSESQAWGYLAVGRELTGRFPKQRVNGWGVEKAKEIARLHRFNPEKVSERVLKLADEGKVSEVRREVTRIIFRDNPDHKEKAKFELMELWGPLSKIRHVRQLLGELRTRPDMSYNDETSDVEIIEMALVEQSQNVVEVEAHAEPETRDELETVYEKAPGDRAEA